MDAVFPFQSPGFQGFCIPPEQERNNWRFIGKGQGIHWEDIDEDISIEGLLAGKPSGESQESFKKWLAKRSEKAS